MSLSRFSLKRGGVSGRDLLKDTEGDAEGQDPRRGELQLVVEQRAVRENPLLDAGLHGTLKHKVPGSEPGAASRFYFILLLLWRFRNFLSPSV